MGRGGGASAAVENNPKHFPPRLINLAFGRESFIITCMEIKADLEIDLRGLRCPLPVLRVKKALGEIGAGGVLRAFADDPGAAEDIPAFVKMAGHEMRGVSAADGGRYFVVVKK